MAELTKTKKNHCAGCRYWRRLGNSGYLHACHYLLDTGHSRRCKVAECDKKEARR